MTNQAPKLELIQDFPFEFYGELYIAHLANDRQFYIKLADVCVGMGLAIEAQRRRVREDEGISDKLVMITADTIYKDSVRKRDVDFLNIRALPYWLGTIDAKRVKPEIYEKVVRFKRSFAETAWQVYRSDLMPPEVLAEMDAYEVPERAEIGDVMDQLRSATKKLDKLEGRMNAIEARMSAEAIINTRQQWQIKAMIEAVGEALFEQKGSKMPRTQCHAVVQNDFKAQFQIPVYSLLHENKMEEAVSYLTQRYQHLKPGVKLPRIFTDGIQQSLL
jgi:hypothetical protein